MPRRKTKLNGNGTVWNAGTAVNVFAIPLITVIFGLGGFYLLTKDTLARHEQAISQIIPKEFDQENKDISAEAKARQNTRDEFLDRLGKINDSIATLNTHAAVQDETDKQIARTLEQISRQLEGGAIKPSRP